MSLVVAVVGLVRTMVDTAARNYGPQGKKKMCGVEKDTRMEHLGRNKNPIRKLGQNVREKTRKIIF